MDQQVQHIECVRGGIRLFGDEDLRPGLESADLRHRRKGLLVLARAILPLMRRPYDTITSRYVPGETVVVASSLAPTGAGGAGQTGAGAAGRGPPSADRVPQRV
jgi:hypothetical protein